MEKAHTENRRKEKKGGYKKLMPYEGGGKKKQTKTGVLKGKKGSVGFV